MNVVDKYATILWEFNKMHHTLEKSDAILVLGSMDKRVAERAAALWHQGLAPTIVTSGGFGRLTGESNKRAEADVFKDILLSRNVPPDAILVENTSTNTGANFELSMKVLKNSGVTPKQVIVVTKPYMEKRAYATIKKLFPHIEAHCTSPQLSMEKYPYDEITRELMLNILVGDTKRVEEYPSKGFTIPMDMPGYVKEAVNALIDLGYDNQLPN